MKAEETIVHPLRGLLPQNMWAPENIVGQQAHQNRIRKCVEAANPPVLLHDALHSCLVQNQQLLQLCCKTWLRPGKEVLSSHLYRPLQTESLSAASLLPPNSACLGCVRSARGTGPEPLPTRISECRATPLAARITSAPRFFRQLSSRCLRQALPPRVLERRKLEPSEREKHQN